MKSAFPYFSRDFQILKNSLKAMDHDRMTELIERCQKCIGGGTRL